MFVITSTKLIADALSARITEKRTTGRDSKLGTSEPDGCGMWREVEMRNAAQLHKLSSWERSTQAAHAQSAEVTWEVDKERAQTLPVSPRRAHASESTITVQTASYASTSSTFCPFRLCWNGGEKEGMRLCFDELCWRDWAALLCSLNNLRCWSSRPRHCGSRIQCL